MAYIAYNNINIKEMYLIMDFCNCYTGLANTVGGAPRETATANQHSHCL